MSFQSTETRNISFLGRKRINQKDELFEAHLRQRTGSTAIVEVAYDTNKIYENVKLEMEFPSLLVIDIFVLGKVTRRILQKKNLRLTEVIVLDDVPEGAVPRLRLKIISDNSEHSGVIFAATAKLIPFKSAVTDGSDDGGVSERKLLDLKQSDDLNGCLSKVGWSANADITITVDRNFYQKFHTKTNMLRLVLYPDMIRSVALNLLSRYDELSDLDESCTGFLWLKFIEDNLGLALQGEDSIYDPLASDTLVDAVEMIVETFMAKQWSGGKTILEGALHGG